MSVILNNKKTEANDTVLSLALYGYGCFTSLVVDQGAVKGFKHHIERLLNDSKALFGLSPNESDIRENIKTFLESKARSGNIVVRVTLFPDGFSIATPEKVDAINIMVTGREQHSVGVKALRLLSVDSTRIHPFQKTTNMLSNLKARAIAHQKGYDDAVMMQNKLITEGATWNIFLGRGKNIITPSLTEGLLPGITRRIILDCGKRLGYSIKEARITTDTLCAYEYGFATNASTGITPIKSIDAIEFDASNDNLTCLSENYRQIPGERVV